jgi:ubiquinone/menaquinone biosynthesis C-methylase UbiE
MPLHSLKQSKSYGWGHPGQNIDSYKCSLLKNLRGDLILDIGSAVGNYTKYISQLGKKAWGLDPNIKLLSQAKYPRIQGSVSHLPFKNNAFDSAVMFDVLEHISEDSLTEINRVIKYNLILTVPQSTPKDLQKNFVLYGHHIDTTHLRTYTPKTLNATLLHHGFKVKKIEPCHPLSTDALFLSLLKGATFNKKLARKISYFICKKPSYYTNLSAFASKDE